jgi:U3 small nucleolar RNA-associated protein 24
MKILNPNYVLVDTNFIYFTIKNKINLNTSLLNCLNSTAVPCVSECILMELEKLGPKFKLALGYLKNRKIIKLRCFHPKDIIYADDCIFHTVNLYRYFIVATCDINLKKRIKKLTNSKLITIKKGKFILI